MVYTPEILVVGPGLALEYQRLFINRLAYAQMTDNRDSPAENRYFRPVLYKGTPQETPKALDLGTIGQHIAGELTCMFYAINPIDQTCKWICIDADYDNALPDLDHMKEALTEDGVSCVFEHSRRGGHLWILNEEPLPAALCRLYINSLADRIGVPVKDSPLRTPYKEMVERKKKPSPGEAAVRVLVEVTVTKEKEGIEVFPKQDAVDTGGFGNGVRGPLGVHRKNYTRYWFAGAPTNLADQLRFLSSTPTLSRSRLEELTTGLSLPVAPVTPTAASIFPKNHPRRDKEFSIFEHFSPPRSGVRMFRVECPACCETHLEISVGGRRNGYYRCFTGCSTDEIRAALGRPIVRKNKI